ncbi:hypothetical protein AAY473_004788 [Plecturocebus cupreus]
MTRNPRYQDDIVVMLILIRLVKAPLPSNLDYQNSRYLEESNLSLTLAFLLRNGEKKSRRGELLQVPVWTLKKPQGRRQKWVIGGFTEDERSLCLGTTNHYSNDWSKR